MVPKHRPHKVEHDKARRKVHAMTPKLILVGGGARSGKSRFALGYAEKLGQRRVFIATAEAGDEEMRQRIRRHRDERGERFRTLEAPLDLARALRDAGDAEVVVIDCLTLWLANRLLRDGEESVATEGIRELVGALAHRRCHTVVVSNEVGLGLVPESALGRSFRDLAGSMHQQLAASADEVYLAAMGMVLRLRPDPVTALRAGEIP
jgi:adenosylcobinamide kinase/adenosylcobinamide-phosphate guanylyltransferase